MQQSLLAVYIKKISGSMVTLVHLVSCYKNITTGEGGLVVTNNKKIAKKLNFYLEVMELIKKGIII